MKKKKVSDSVTINRKARYDYVLGEELSCGLVLSGLDVRAIRDHHDYIQVFSKNVDFY